MVTSFTLCPVEINMCVTRGDTSPWTYTFTSGGSGVNIAGFSFVLTVDPSDEPADATNNLFALTGTITDAPNGVVSFEMSASEADQTPNTYFFDLQQTDGAGKLRTVVKGEFVFEQDISK